MTASQALRNSVQLAQRAEQLGYSRYWFAEHHGMPSIGSSAPEIMIEHIASATSHMRVGSGGIMLPNHAPMRIAEAFLTLEALHPGRIDLGIGRAPGADPTAAAAMRPFDAEQFPEQLSELIHLAGGGFADDHPFRNVRAVPGDVPLPPIWLLGSSGASARFAGSLGLGYSFARHFSPTPPEPAMLAYRENFKPSAHFAEPHAILAVAVVCAESNEQAEYLAASLDLMWLRIRRGEFKPIPSPEEALAYPYTERERAAVVENRKRLVMGTAAQVRTAIELLAQQSRADEVMVTTMIHEHTLRMRSFELIAAEFDLKSD